MSQLQTTSFPLVCDLSTTTERLPFSGWVATGVGMDSRTAGMGEGGGGEGGPGERSGGDLALCANLGSDFEAQYIRIGKSRPDVTMQTT